LFVVDRAVLDESANCGDRGGGGKELLPWLSEVENEVVEKKEER
jgi:hypothetical protein